MTQDEFSAHLSAWLDSPHKTIKRVALFAGYSSIYVGFIRNGRCKASPRLIGEFLEAMRTIDAKTPPKVERDYSNLPPTPRNLARAAKQKRYVGVVCGVCGCAERYAKYNQCVRCAGTRWQS